MFDAFFGERVPGEGNDLGGVRVGRAGERGMKVDETRGLLGAFAAEEQRRRGETRMMQQHARELGTGIASDASDGDAQRIGARC